MALKAGGYLILTDFFAASDEEEMRCRQELDRLKREQGFTNQEFCHYDTPLTVEHEMQALQEAGFRTAEVIDHWGATCLLRAEK